MHFIACKNSKLECYKHQKTDRTDVDQNADSITSLHFQSGMKANKNEEASGLLFQVTANVKCKFSGNSLLTTVAMIELIKCLVCFRSQQM